MKYYCKGCNIKAVQIQGTKPLSRLRATGNKYCMIYDGKLNHKCPCKKCLLMGSCTKVCESRVNLREKAFKAGRRRWYHVKVV